MFLRREETKRSPRVIVPWRQETATKRLHEDRCKAKLHKETGMKEDAGLGG